MSSRPIPCCCPARSRRRNTGCQILWPALCTTDYEGESFERRERQPARRPELLRDGARRRSRKCSLNPALVRKRELWLQPHEPGLWWPGRSLSAHSSQPGVKHSKRNGPCTASWLVLL